MAWLSKNTAKKSIYGFKSWDVGHLTCDGHGPEDQGSESGQLPTTSDLWMRNISQLNHNQSYLKWSIYMIFKTLESLDIYLPIQRFCGFALFFSRGTIWVCLKLRLPPNHSKSKGLSQWFQQRAIPKPAERMWAVFTLLTEKTSECFFSVF